MLPGVTEWYKHYRKVLEVGGDKTIDFPIFMDTLKLHRTMLQFLLISRSLVRTQQSSPRSPHFSSATRPHFGSGIFSPSFRGFADRAQTALRTRDVSSTRLARLSRPRLTGQKSVLKLLFGIHACANPSTARCSAQLSGKAPMRDRVRAERLRGCVPSRTACTIAGSR